MLTLHFDYPSPASALALLRVQAVADAGGAVAFAGFDALGVDVSVPVTLDQLEEFQRVAPRAAALGLELRRPTRRPPTVAAHAVGELAERCGVGAAWRRACLDAYWQHDADLGTTDVLVELGAAAGLDPDQVRAEADDPAARRAVRQRMVAARRAGVGAVPVLEAQGALVSVEVADDDLRALADL